MSEAARTAAGELSDARPSFEEFFERHRRDVFAALVLVTRDRHEAEEVAQEAFVRIWQRWDRVDTIEDLTAYAFATAMNVWRSRLRRAEVALRRVIHTIPSDEMANIDAEDSVVRALGHLTPRQRAVVILTDLLGWTSEEAGRALRIRASTVRVLSSRAHERLRQHMDGGTP